MREKYNSASVKVKKNFSEGLNLCCVCELSNKLSILNFLLFQRTSNVQSCFAQSIVFKIDEMLLHLSYESVA